MLELFDKLKGWRTKITGHLGLTIPGIIDLLTQVQMFMDNQPTNDIEWFIALAKILGGTLVHFFRNRA